MPRRLRRPAKRRRVTIAERAIMLAGEICEARPILADVAATDKAREISWIRRDVEKSLGRAVGDLDARRWLRLALEHRDTDARAALGACRIAAELDVLERRRRDRPRAVRGVAGA